MRRIRKSRNGKPVYMIVGRRESIKCFFGKSVPGRKNFLYKKESTKNRKKYAAHGQKGKKVAFPARNFALTWRNENYTILTDRLISSFDGCPDCAWCACRNPAAVLFSIDFLSLSSDLYPLSPGDRRIEIPRGVSSRAFRSCFCFSEQAGVNVYFCGVGKPRMSEDSQQCIGARFFVVGW